MSNSIRLILALHNHQPIGNFDHVFEQAYQDSYLPFLDTFSRYPTLKIALHTSGPLMEWLDEHHKDYVDRLAALVAEGRIEIIGGAFYEPILAMLPRRDRVGQIRSYTEWLTKRLGADVRGMWMPERVWEQSMTTDLVEADIKYTILDDFHFKCAGMGEDDLHGHLITEDEGRVLSVFPGSERLRYLIPFGSPEDTLRHLHEIAERQPGAIVLFGDDGEKFGTWPGTNKHVYNDRWLENFFNCLVANQNWINITTPREALEEVAPIGKVYLPDCSYREMTEWTLPADRLTTYEHLVHEMEPDHRWEGLRQFMRGGIWRNFKIKYPESNEMYARMMMVSRRLHEAEQAGMAQDVLESARRELYRGQCNCSYWHGAFGGVYLPHLRNAVYKHLIRADKLIDKAVSRDAGWVEAVTADFDFDGRPEIRLADEKMMAIVAPSRGGRMLELDVFGIEQNLLATLTRRPEAYHEKVLGGENQGNDGCGSIHDRVVFKQKDLDQRLQYDAHPRKSLLDLFYSHDATLDDVAQVRATELGGFFNQPYEARVRRNPDRIQVQLTRDGQVGDVPVKLSKALTLSAGSDTLEIAYMLEGLPQGSSLHFGIEMNFAAMPAGADDRYFSDPQGHHLGDLGSRLNLTDIEGLTLTDDWLGIDARMSISRPTRFWTFPVEAVSQSEGGFELIHQSVCVMPHWIVEPDEEGRWLMTMNLQLDTSKAESRNHNELATSTAG